MMIKQSFFSVCSSPTVKWENQLWTPMPTSSSPGSTHRSVCTAANTLPAPPAEIVTKLFSYGRVSFCLSLCCLISPNQPTPRHLPGLRANPAPPSWSSPLLCTARRCASPRCIPSHQLVPECRWDSHLVMTCRSAKALHLISHLSVWCWLSMNSVKPPSNNHHHVHSKHPCIRVCLYFPSL